MSQRGRDPRLNRRRQEDYCFDHEVATDRGRCFRGRPARAIATGHSRPTAAHRFSEGELTDANYKTGRRAEKYDYGHRRDRSRSPFAITDSSRDYSKKQQCETNTHQNESIQITVGNDKFLSPFSSRLRSEEDTFSQTHLTAAGRASTHDRHDYAEETPSVTRAREMALRTREMLSKLTGWTPLSLQPLSSDHVNTTERPAFINVSNSAYTKVSASSEMAQSILRNIRAVASAFCPKESGGIAHIKHEKLRKVRKSTAEDDDDDKFLYGEQLIPEKIENALSRLPGADESQLKCFKSASGDQSLNLTEPSNRKPNDGECDPVVANVLKSIGFNFELSKIMQEKAKREREENEKNRVLIQQASSFLAKQVAGKPHNAQEVSTDDNEALAAKHVGDDLYERRKDADILYDDFSNSDDEFSGTEKKNWTASSTKSELSLGKGWQNLQMAHTSPSGVGFPLGVPSPVSLLATPPLRHPPVANVQPQPPSAVLPLQSSSLLLPPPSNSNSQPVHQLLSSWPAYQVPLTIGTLPKWKSKASRVANEVEWEQNTQEFLRRLQEPRTTELLPNQEARLSRSRSSSLNSTSNERVKKRQEKKRSASKELWSGSHERKTKRQRGEKVTIPEHRKSSDQVTQMKRMSFLKEKLNCMKKEHSQLMNVKQKSTHTKEKLKLNRHHQDELHARIQALADEINGRSTESRSGFALNDEHSPGHTQQRESKVMATKRRYSGRNSKQQNREREEKKFSLMHRELSVDKKELSSKAITDKRAGLIDCSPKKEQMLSTGCPTENKLMSVGVKAEVSIETTKELDSRKEILVKKSSNSHGKGYLESVGDEPKEETRKKADEKSLEDRRDTRSKDELQRSKVRYDYYDGGDNWCSICNSLFPKLSEFLDHLHCTSHQQIVASEQTSLIDKPWKLLQVLQSKPHSNLPPISESASGMEFLLPVKGFFCTLCQKFSGDCDDAELHVLSEEHNAKFKQHCSDNPAYQKGYRCAKMEKMAVRKLDKEKTQMEKGQIEKNLMSCITDSGNENPVTKQTMHVGKKLKKPSSETATINSAESSIDLTQTFLPLEYSLEQNSKTVDGNLLNQANKNFVGLTKETAAVFSSDTVVSRMSGQACITETKVQTLLSSEISEVQNFCVNVKACNKQETTLTASLQGEADVRLNESLNVENDTVKNSNSRNPTMKPADTEAAEQTDLKIHLVQVPTSMDSSEAVANESLKILKMKTTACMLDSVRLCDISNHLSDANAECNTGTFVKVTAMPKTLPVAVSEVQSVMIQLDYNTRNTNVSEPATGGDMAESCSTYLSQVEVAEKEDPTTCQSQKPLSTEIEDKDDLAICQSQKPSSTEIEEKDDLAIFQSQKPSSTEIEEKDDLATCQSQKPSSTEIEEKDDPATCQSQKPLSTEIEDKDDLAICQSQKPSSTMIEEKDDLAICQSQKPSSTEIEEKDDLATCQSQKPSSTEIEEKDDLATCQSQKPSSTEIEEKDDPAICQSQKPLSTEIEDKDDPATCQSQKPLSTEIEDKDDLAICQSQKPSSTEIEEKDDLATCQSQKPSSTEIEEKDDLAICQSQKPSSAEIKEKEDPAAGQSQKPSSAEIEDKEDPAACQSQKPSSAEIEEKEDPAAGQSQKPLSTEIEDKDDLAICQSQKPSSTEIEDKDDLAIYQSQKPSSAEIEEKDDPATCQSQKTLSY